MLFADKTLAARIEHAESRLTFDSVTQASHRPDADVLLFELGGGVAAFGGAGSPFNKVSGIGSDGSVDEDQLAQIEAAFAERKTPVQVELSCLADPEVGALLTRRGYVLQAFENVLGRRLADTAALPPPAGIEIRPSGTDELGAFLDLVVEGFANPDGEGLPAHESFPREVLDRVIEDMTGIDGFVRYVAVRDGELAGGASMRMYDGILQMCGAATLPRHRRQGIQTALLRTRLAAAAAAGCELAVVTTAPGSKSQLNAQRQGFELLYTRAILIRGAGD